MEVVVDDKGKHYDYHSCHVCEEEMLNRHETDLTTLIPVSYTHLTLPTTAIV